MPREFKVGDRVRIKDPVLDLDHAPHTIRRIDKTRIGKPCWLATSSGDMRIWPYPSDLLELVKSTTEDPRDARIRELEERIQKIERHLGWIL